jgi:L-arabinose isomerase
MANRSRFEDMQTSFKIGLCGIGLHTYWAQFEGLEERLAGYVAEVARRLHLLDAEVVSGGLVDNPDKAMEAGHLFRASDVDLIFIYATTYALSSTVLPLVWRSRVPVVILNLTPAPAIDYAAFNALGDRTQMTGEWLAFCSACPVPEIANVFQRAGVPFHQVTGTLYDDAAAWAEIGDWVSAARVAHTMRYNRLGVMGNYYGGMLDIYTDLTLQLATFGGHVEVLEVDELSALRAAVSSSGCVDKIADFRRVFDVGPDCASFELERAARTAVALDQLVERHRLGSLAYYHKGTGNPANEETIASIILGASFLTARDTPVAGEYEIKNAQAMKIMAAFGAGGSFSEYYALDFTDDVVLMGHDGPCHPAIAEGRIRVRPLQVYHGKVGAGLSVEMSVRHGDVTLLSVVERGGRIFFLVAEGASVPGPILQIGNTNSRYRFSCGARSFAGRWNAQGPAHHCAIGVGHLAGRIGKLGAILGIETICI